MVAPDTQLPITSVPVSVATPAAQGNVVVLQEIIKRLPTQLGLSPELAGMFNPSYQVLAALGRFRRVRISGQTIFVVASTWNELGIPEDGARASVYRRPPTKDLAPADTMRPLTTLYHAAYTLCQKLGSYNPHLDAYYFTFKSEPKLMRAYAEIQTRFIQKREELIGHLPELWAWAEPRIVKSAREAHQAAVQVMQMPDETTFVSQVVARTHEKFPTPASLRAKLTLTLEDRLPPELEPTEDMVQAVLGLKELIEAEARTAQASAEEAEGMVALLRMKQQAERELIEQMRNRQNQILTEEIRSKLEGPLLAIQHCEALVHDSIARALDTLGKGRKLSGAQIAALKRVRETYELVSMGNVALDEKMIALDSMLRLPAAERPTTSFNTLLNEIESMTAVAAERMRMADEPDQWDSLFGWKPEETIQL